MAIVDARRSQEPSTTVMATKVVTGTVATKVVTGTVAVRGWRSPITVNLFFGETTKETRVRVETRETACSSRKCDGVHSMTE